MSGIRTIYKNMPAWVVFLLILTFGSIIFAAGVAINSQTKTTAVASGDVFPSYNAAAGAGRGITASNLANGLAALITEGSYANSTIVSADIKDETITTSDVLNDTLTTSDIKDGTIALGDLADADWGAFTKSTTFALDTNSVDSGQITAGAVDLTHIADADWGDFTKSTTFTLDADVVGPNEIADGTYGQIVFSGGEAALGPDCVAVAEFLASQDWGDMSTDADGNVTLDADVVAAAEMADADHGDVSWSSGVATVDSGAVLLSELGNPGGSKTFTMADSALTFRSANDQWGGLLIDNTQGTLAGETKLLSLQFAVLKTDTNANFFEIIADSDGTPVTILKIAGAATRPVMTGDVTWYADSINLDSIDNLDISGTNIDEVDISWETGQTFTTITATGAIVGELSEIDEGAVASNNLTAAQLRGTLLTNEGDADGETWELPAAESGLHFKVVCAETQDIVLDAGASDGIYVSDDDAISAPSGDDNNVTMDCANVGESMTCITFSQDGSTWDWLCECGAGSCAEAA